MCSRPVTFGGGMGITNGSFPESVSVLKKPPYSQNRYQWSSISEGLWAVDFGTVVGDVYQQFSTLEP